MSVVISDGVTHKQRDVELHKGIVMIKDATISECGTYRYELKRTWDPGKPVLEWIMLNPSIADASIDDPTIKRCIAFAQAWGFGSIVVHNVFALRATDPKELMTHADPYGPLNDKYLGTNTAKLTVVAWGANPATRTLTAQAAIACLPFFRTHLVCLGVNANLSPKHPLYVKSSTTPIPWAQPVVA